MLIITKTFNLEDFKGYTKYGLRNAATALQIREQE